MSPDASSLHCPNCGAAVETDAARCPYCRARLAAVSCPSCFARMFAGAAFCEKCGARRARSEPEDTAVTCPSCRNGLQRVQVGPTAMLECATCDGVWVDAEDFERLCADRESQQAVLHRLARSASTELSTPVRYRPCPRCDKMMNRVNFGRLSGAVVDICKGHGTFLDAGELHQIVTFIQAGGLERARARTVEELRDEQRRLADAQRKAARERDRSAHSVSSSAGGSVLDAGFIADLIDMIGGKRS
jgi:Zn-finger nucleic acid-binding protein